MKSKKIILAGFGVLSIALLISSFVNESSSSQTLNQYSDDPPLVKRVTIQKLPIINPDSTNLIIRVMYDYYEPLPETLEVFSSGTKFLLHDDGQLGDYLSGDMEYACYARVNLNDLVAKLNGYENQIISDGYVMYFDGHDGFQEINVLPFNEIDFLNGMEVEVDQRLILAKDCDNELIKHQSLFITDLSVVEDPARTFNCISETGNPVGLYTFGNLMKNMANQSSTSVTAKNFVKSWLKPYTQDVYDPSSYFLHWKREFVLKFLIAPWISKADGQTEVDNTINLGNWESRWDAQQESDLLKYAPFKLTAIVNRLDLRGNMGYSSALGKAGETRFIYSLVNIYQVDASEDPDSRGRGNIGEPTSNMLHGGSSDFLDWQGMNVIFEYRNVQTSKCALQQYAQDWLDLSELAMGTETYNAALEDITETVINANATPSKPNGSAIGRIRSNEKILFKTLDKNISSGSFSVTWGQSNWQFRQFEINNLTHLLEEVSLNNTPTLEFYNSPRIIDRVSLTNGVTQDVTAMIATGGYNFYISKNLTSWAFDPKNKFQILRERHRMPRTYAGERLLDIGGETFLEYNHYLDLDYGDATSNIPNFNYSNEANGNNQMARDLRHKLSLNTCQGCHCGETKTAFTQVAPLGYGQSANYWGSVPDYKTGKIDAVGRSQVSALPNTGKTLEGDGTTISDNYPVPSGSRNFVNVSAFITGRTYNSGSFQDDLDKTKNNNNLVSTEDDQLDNTLGGLYKVNDPSNAYQANILQNLFGFDDRKNGFNELERRKQDMCKLLRSNCNLIFDDDEAQLMDFVLFLDEITKNVVVE
ncbi:MAG: hypothetical protein H6607_10375 [Flavobacteriales bacterium]|nr:hypothetical protein [Flavobacteriales bacterium]